MKLIISSFCISVVCVWSLLILIRRGSATYSHGSSGCTDPEFPDDIRETETIVFIMYCPITDIPVGALDHVTGLSMIYFWRIDVLTTFPNLTGVAKTLYYVDLRYTDLVYINPTWLDALYNLHILIFITNRRLNHIPDVQGLNKLMRLSLTGSNFSSLPQLTYCTKLQTLRLDQNTMT